MYRVRFTLPPRNWVRYRHLDVFHDALVQAWERTGIAAAKVTGPSAKVWNFAALGHHEGHKGRAHTLVVATPDAELSEGLKRMEPAWIRYARVSTGEQVDFTPAQRQPDPDPLVPGQTQVGVLLLSPLLLRLPGQRRWCMDLRETDVSAAVSRRLSRLAGRPIHLEIHPDSLYLRANPRHSVLVSLKGGRGHGFAIGLQAPLVICGDEADLRYAWYAGIGEKNRMGCGCLGSIETGVGR